jgi:hypothetical protein
MEVKTIKLFVVWYTRTINFQFHMIARIDDGTQVSAVPDAFSSLLLDADA